MRAITSRWSAFSKDDPPFTYHRQLGQVAEHRRHLLHSTVARQAAVSGSVPILSLANASKT
ncbi:uncharacterized protein QC761_101832 [Podospora bellae-mahoneyi]|uniref:Uncharacterized protein n=1 Tax=Podospora bellae-mahoneyi TaxID=2093777 RepID=A0ABR0FWI6_9PEZI|nr:hypothetical protein QC761_101832 [Podospora bellae-mahoneyi]